MRTARLRDVCEFKPSKRLARIGLSEGDPVSFVPMNELGIHQKYLTARDERPLSEVAGSYTYFAEGDVLLAKITPCFENGKLGIARGLTNGVGFGSSEFTVIRPGAEVLPEYVYYFLDRDDVRERGERVMTGAVGHKRVPQEFVEALEIPLPPLEEQRRIVAVLDEAFAAIAIATANAEKNLLSARQLPSSALTKLDIAGGDAEPRRLGDLVTRLTNGYVGPTRNIYVDEGIPYLLARHVRDDVLTFDGRTHITSAFNSANKKSILAAGDVLLVQSGHIGHSAVVPPKHVGHNCHAMIVITPKPMLLGEYLSAYFNSTQGRSATARIRSGSTVPHLTCKEVRELMIPLPSVEAQRALVEMYKAIQRHAATLATLTEQKLGKLTTLTQSLLHRAFSGELTEREPLAA